MIPGRGKLLEIGAGSGWQAKELSRVGFAVTAIDLLTSNYREKRVWPVTDYNGQEIPAEDLTFDFIFSSNTLEHVVGIEKFLLEIKRVMKRDALAIHIMPTSTWRFSSALGHYLRFDRVIYELSKLWKTPSKKSSLESGASDYRTISSPNQTLPGWIKHRILPPLHGIRGNILTEHWYFTEKCWRKLFETAGYEVLDVRKNNLYYTGHYFLAELLTIDARRRLSCLLGSSCKIYLLKVAS